MGILRSTRPILFLLGLLCLGPALSGAGQVSAEKESIDGLAAAVKDLGLGAGDFVIGARLTPDQTAFALANPVEDAYAGTIKFGSGDVVVVADEENHLVLAVYRRLEGARAGDVKQMIGHLMNRFGEPTTMAHGRLVYWAYGPEGKIGEEAYLAAKTSGRIDILATVKFNSTLDVNPGMDDENTEETGTIYYIITSDRLLNSFISSP